MNYLQTFERFEGVKKTKKIKKHWRSDRGGVSSVMGSIANKDANLNDLMKKLVKRFKIEKVKYMNAGAFGMAFIADGDKIIKLTSNRDEAAEVKGLIDKKVPGCIEYYDIVYSKKFDIWAILMQKCENLSKKEEKIFSLLFEEGLDNFDEDNLDRSQNFSKDRINDIASELRLSKEELMSFIRELVELKDKLESNDISIGDLHTGNMGRLDDELVHFDIMAGFTGENELNKISKIKLGEEQDSLEKAFIKTKISPQVDKVNIKSIYSVLFIQVDGYVENVDGKGKYMMIDLNYSSYTSVHETLDGAVENLTSDESVSYDYCDSWEVFKGQNSDRFVNVLEYNDTNFQEIENILLDYGIQVENMWGLIR